MAFDYFFEERMWYLAAVEDTINLKMLPQIVEKVLKERIKQKKKVWTRKRNLEESQIFQQDEPPVTLEKGFQFFVYDFSMSLSTAFQDYCPWAKP
mmetsp:Transcript_7583/g.6935  ORF Transcript_7583/g.6935 Transcript_7583/m.6935 type:complete len:95 (+) Transcript_7583:1862-2146(+)